MKNKKMLKTIIRGPIDGRRKDPTADGESDRPRLTIYKGRAKEIKIA